eukprot:TRINITY_DN174_c0_g1_i1.p2 TRINITY_DN174_c0_g1~~TRINITY_DN174_c0_g1_i1.p2  ORF type:complete len:269 (+),score=146.45 TRINITY_DN174_c0_g1_i1:43-849(+)
MGRGPKKHMKRLAAPRHWMVDKLAGVYAPKARPGAHKERESLPLILILRNRMKLALTRNEAMLITKQRLVTVDGRVKCDPKTPVGFMDVLAMPKAKEQFRVMYDVKGRFVMQKITAEQAESKLCKVTAVSTTAGNVPVCRTHDGRTLRYPDPLVSAGDTVKLDLASGRITDFIKFKEGTLVMVTGGANTGRVGKVMDVERHPGSFDIVHVRDENDNTFATRKGNVFIIGRAESEVTLPKGKGIRIPLEQDRKIRIETLQKAKAGKKRH